MGFWRREPLHEKLAREGGLVRGGRAPHDTTPRWGEVGIHGVARPRRWDAVVTVEAPGLEGEELAFVTLPDGTLLIEDEAGDHDLGPLADALETEMAPPYRAEAVRRDGDRWAVAARRIEVLELPDDFHGQQLELTVHDDRRTLVVDGLPRWGRVPALEQIGERFESYVVRGERLDGPLWEVTVTPL